MIGRLGFPKIFSAQLLQLPEDLLLGTEHADVLSVLVFAKAAVHQKHHLVHRLVDSLICLKIAFLYPERRVYVESNGERQEPEKQG